MFCYTTHEKRSQGQHRFLFVKCWKVSEWIFIKMYPQSFAVVPLHPGFAFFFRCYNLGFNINPLGISKLPPTLPAPLSTPSLSSYIRWDHAVSWRVPQPEEFLSGQSGRQTEAIFEVDISVGSKDHFMLDHLIDGRALYPAAGYLVLGWKMLAKSRGHVFEKMPVVFRNVSIHRATVLPSTGICKALLF